MQPTINKLQVPGASLYHEVRGKGPLLVLIPGGNGDAAPFERLANELGRDFTVVTYDRRGFSRSPVDGDVDDARRLEIDGDDVIRLIDASAEQRAHVLGSSSGAIVALDLIARHPARIRTAVIHEPPLLTLLPDAATHLQFLEDVYDTYKTVGIEQAMMKFSAGIGLQRTARPPPGAELPPQMITMMSRMRRNFVFLMEHELRQYPRTILDFAALEAVSSRLVLAGGRDSHEHIPYRPNLVIAARLGLQVVDFPGDHMGYATQPVEFAAQLGEILSRR